MPPLDEVVEDDDAAAASMAMMRISSSICGVDLIIICGNGSGRGGIGRHTTDWRAVAMVKVKPMDDGVMVWVRYDT